MFLKLAWISFPILLVDEVLAVGDIDFQRKCYDSFENFKKNGRTILFVNHDLDTVERFCDRVILLEKGEIVNKGSSSDIVKSYKTSDRKSGKIAVNKI